MASIESNGSKERMDERLERMHEIECRICDFNIDGVCKLDGQHIPKIGCAGGKEKPMTNADRIRAMTDEELADELYFWHFSIFCRSDEEILKWLKAEVKVND